MLERQSQVHIFVGEPRVVEEMSMQSSSLFVPSSETEFGDGDQMPFRAVGRNHAGMT